MAESNDVHGHAVDIALARLEEQVKSMDTAQKLQAKEYARRLDELNHAHEQAREVLGTYLPRETWEAWIKDEGQRREKLDDEIQELRRDISNSKSVASAAAANTNRNIAVAVVIIGIISFLANLVTSGVF